MYSVSDPCIKWEGSSMLQELADRAAIVDAVIAYATALA
jgi:hypothetical protein